MTREETIQILSKINEYRPAYFKKMDAKSKLDVISNWHLAFASVDYSSVDYALDIFLKGSKFAPFPREIQKILDERKAEIEKNTNPWYKHFNQEGEVFYHDKDIAWASFADWNNMPKELSDRMHYKPDTEDEDRNKILASCLALRQKLLGNEA